MSRIARQFFRIFLIRKNAKERMVIFHGFPSGQITFKLSDDEYTRLQAACERANETIQAFCRRAAVKELEKNVPQGRTATGTQARDICITNIARRRRAVKEAQL